MLCNKLHNKYILDYVIGYIMAFDNLAIGVLRKMFMYGYIGGKHTSIDNLQKSFPKHERGNVKGVVKDLIKANLIIPKPTGYGLHCSLNPEKIQEISEIIQDTE